MRTSDQEKELITEATPKTETKLAEKKPDTTSTTTAVDTTPEKSPATETKNSTISEIPNSATTPVEPKTEKSPAVEDKNPTVSKVPNSATNSVEPKTEKSPAVETKKPTVSEISNSTTTPVQTKTENSPATETQNPTVSDIPNFPTNPVSTEIDDITGDKIETTVFIQPEISAIPAASADILTGEIADISPTPTNSPEILSEIPENLSIISPSENSTLWETLNNIFAQQLPQFQETASSQNYPPSASEYIVTYSPAIIPEIAVSENYDSQQSENITADSHNQQPTTIDEYVNPNFDSENIAITKAHLLKNPSPLATIPVPNKPQTPITTVTEIVNPNQTANTEPAMQLITATAKTIGVQNQPQTIATRAKTQIPSVTVQIKLKEKPNGHRAAMATVTPTLTAAKKTKSINPIHRVAVAAVSTKMAAAATTVQLSIPPGTILQLTTKQSAATRAILIPKVTVIITAVTMTASQKTKATQTRIPSISPSKRRAATAATIGVTIEIMITQSRAEITQTLTKTGEKLETTIATIIQSASQTLPAATVRGNPALKTSKRAIQKVRTSGIASTKLILTRPKVTATNRQ